MPMEHLLVDSNFLFARFNRGDRHHREASKFLSEQKEAGGVGYSLVYTDYIFDETITAILFHSNRHDIAAAAGKTLRESSLEMVRIEPPVFEAAWSLFLDHPDKHWSFTDCTSFVLMEKLGIRGALTFDRNFREAGFATFP